MTASAPEVTLQETLTKLETALLSPVTSGELAGWIKSVGQASKTVCTDWTCYLRTTMQPAYAEIAETDTDFLSKVEKMTKEDSELFEECAKFQEELQALQDRTVSNFAPSSQQSKLEDHRKHIEDKGLSLITRMRRQKAAAATWLLEAVFHDQGVGD